jgi:hypothetical protein
MVNPLIARMRKINPEKRIHERSSGNDGISIPDADGLQDMADMADIEPEFQSSATSVDEDLYEPESNVMDLIGDNSNASDAAAALRAFLGDGDVKASAHLTKRQLVAVWDLIHVGEVLNSVSLLDEVQSYLLLTLSENGIGREQAIKAFNGLYEPNRGGQDGSAPGGQVVRPPRF